MNKMTFKFSFIILSIAFLNRPILAYAGPVEESDHREQHDESDHAAIHSAETILAGAELHNLGITTEQASGAMRRLENNSTELRSLVALIHLGESTGSHEDKTLIAAYIQSSSRLESMPFSPSTLHSVLISWNADKKYELANLLKVSVTVESLTQTIRDHNLDPSSSTVVEYASELDLAKASSHIEQKASEWLEQRKCMSCHTVLPYAIARGGQRVSNDATLHKLRTYIENRIGNWQNTNPWYGFGESGKAAESRGTELIISATILNQMESRPSELTKSVMDHLVNSQQEDGSWEWLNFNLEPWESSGGRIYGASLAAIAFSKPGIVENPAYHHTITKLQAYLRSAFNHPQTSLLNRMAILWADGSLRGTLTDGERSHLVSAIFSSQNADGGWSMNKITPFTKRGHREEAAPGASDAFSTAFALIALQAAHPPGAHQHQEMQKAASWLKTHQNTDGTWTGISVNRNSPFNESLQSDAATSFAIFALQNHHSP